MTESQRNPYDYHKYLISKYVSKDKKVDTSKWKTDQDVINENSKFIWDEIEPPASWEERLAKKYYDKLFKEYCICDLSRYKENLIANRFRVEKEVVTGKGQFICAEKGCKLEEGLRTWEVNFAYSEAGVKKNTLVKIRLCADCSEKLNYHTRKREVKRLAKKSTSKRSSSKPLDPTSASHSSTEEPPLEDEKCEEIIEFRQEAHSSKTDENLWKQSDEAELKGRDEEFDEYLADLLL